MLSLALSRLWPAPYRCLARRVRPRGRRPAVAGSPGPGFEGEGKRRSPVLMHVEQHAAGIRACRRPTMRSRIAKGLRRVTLMRRRWRRSSMNCWTCPAIRASGTRLKRGSRVSFFRQHTHSAQLFIFEDTRGFQFAFRKHCAKAAIYAQIRSAPRGRRSGECTALQIQLRPTCQYSSTRSA
jgi:hypothetical protein